jgi:hypothetical protein
MDNVVVVRLGVAGLAIQMPACLTKGPTTSTSLLHR